MKHTFGKQARQAGLVLAAVAAFAALGIGTAQADTLAAPAGVPTFVSANISIEPRGEAAGGLTCQWRETGLIPSSVVNYTCSAGAVGALKACVYKNRVIYQSPTQLDKFKNVVPEEGGTVPYLSQKNGQISGSTTTAVPEIEVEPGTELCLAPAEITTVAVRWCNASLADLTNNIVGATAAELFQEFFPGVGTVPSCAELLQ